MVIAAGIFLCYPRVPNGAGRILMDLLTLLFLVQGRPHRQAKKPAVILQPVELTISISHHTSKDFLFFNMRGHIFFKNDLKRCPPTSFFLFEIKSYFLGQVSLKFMILLSQPPKF